MYLRAISAFLVLNLLFGCATAQITPIRRGDPVAIVVSKSPQADGSIDIGNEALGNNAGKGAGSGAVAGALWGLACGPFFILCSPILAAIGAVTGTAAGAAVGATGSLSSEKAARLRARLVRVQQSHSLPAELQKNINDRAQKYWQQGTDQSAARVTIELQDLMLRSTRDEQISCIVRAQVSVLPRGAKQAASPEQKTYEYVSTFIGLPLWLDEGSDFVDTLLTSASQQIAANIVSDLALN